MSSLEKDSSSYKGRVSSNINLARYIANKFIKHQNDRRYTEDILSSAYFGLVKAAKTFDESKGTKFSSYAGVCIENQIKMFYRDNKPTTLETSIYTPVSEHDDNLLLLDRIMDENVDVEKKFMDDDFFITIINAAFNKLNYVEFKCFISFLYRRPQKIIAQELGLSQSYVSRIENKALKKVGETFENEGGPFLMEKMLERYRLMIRTADIENFNLSFSDIIKELGCSGEKIPAFSIVCKDGELVMQVPPTQAGFSFIAEFVGRVKEYQIKYGKEKSKKSDETNVETTKDISSVTASTVTTSSESDSTTQVEEKDCENIEEKKASKSSLLREWVLEQEEFSTKQLFEKFGSKMERGLIGGVLSSMKRAMLIESTSRGMYRVLKK